MLSRASRDARLRLAATAEAAAGSAWWSSSLDHFLEARQQWQMAVKMLRKGRRWWLAEQLRRAGHSDDAMPSECAATPWSNVGQMALGLRGATDFLRLLSDTMHSTSSSLQLVQGAPCSVTLHRTLRARQHWHALEALLLTERPVACPSRPAWAALRLGAWNSCWDGGELELSDMVAGVSCGVVTGAAGGSMWGARKDGRAGRRRRGRPCVMYRSQVGHSGVCTALSTLAKART